MMQLIPPEQLVSGNRLAETVYDKSGAILMAKDRELDAHLIHILCRNKIAEVAITVESTLAEQVAFASELKACLDRRFERVSGHPLMDSLKQMVFEYRYGERGNDTY